MVVRSAIALRAALVSTLACVACSTTRAPAASESARGRSNSVGQPLARLQRMSECWGPCPDYAVEIDIDGNLNYRGGDNVLTHGSATGRLSAEEMNKLREALERWRHFQFVAEPCGLCSCVTDSAGIELTTWEEGLPRAIRYAVGCPRVPIALVDLERAIDRVAERWIGTRAQRDACFVEKRDCTGLVGWPEVSP